MAIVAGRNEDYWLKQAGPVMLVIGTFPEGERMDMKSIQGWRNRLLGLANQGHHCALPLL